MVILQYLKKFIATLISRALFTFNEGVWQYVESDGSTIIHKKLILRYLKDDSMLRTGSDEVEITKILCNSEGSGK